MTTNGATWLDRELLAKTPMPRVDFGFGNEVRSALYRRQQWLIEQGLMQRDAGMVVFRTNLLATLARREVAQKGQELAQQSGTPSAWRRTANGSPAATRARWSL